MSGHREVEMDDAMDTASIDISGGGGEAESAAAAAAAMTGVDVAVIDQLLNAVGVGNFSFQMDAGTAGLTGPAPSPAAGAGAVPHRQLPHLPGQLGPAGGLGGRQFRPDCEFGCITECLGASVLGADGATPNQGARAAARPAPYAGPVAAGPLLGGSILPAGGSRSLGPWQPPAAAVAAAAALPAAFAAAAKSKAPAAAAAAAVAVAAANDTDAGCPLEEVLDNLVVNLE